MSINSLIFETYMQIFAQVEGSHLLLYLRAKNSAADLLNFKRNTESEQKWSSRKLGPSESIFHAPALLYSLEITKSSSKLLVQQTSEQSNAAKCCSGQLKQWQARVSAMLDKVKWSARDPPDRGLREENMRSL